MTEHTKSSVNEYLIKISKAAMPIDGDIELGSDYFFNGYGEVTQMTEKSNDDGTVNRIYSIKGILAEVKKK